ELGVGGDSGQAIAEGADRGGLDPDVAGLFGPPGQGGADLELGDGLAHLRPRLRVGASARRSSSASERATGGVKSASNWSRQPSASASLRRLSSPIWPLDSKRLTVPALSPARSARVSRLQSRASRSCFMRAARPTATSSGVSRERGKIWAIIAAYPR